MTRHEIYWFILETGILNIREAAASGDAQQCFAEADHIHNMPALLRNPDDEDAQQLYACCMRPSYISLSKPKWRRRFTPFWNALDELDTNYGKTP
jgi:hypothetical protein